MLRRLETSSQMRKKIITLVAVLVVAVVFLEIWAVNRLATYGEQINKLEKAKAALLLENQVLENEIAQKSSLSEMAVLSEYLGFTKVSKMEYVQGSQGLALNH